MAHRSIDGDVSTKDAAFRNKGHLGRAWGEASALLLLHGNQDPVYLVFSVHLSTTWGISIMMTDVRRHDGDD